MKTYIPVFKIKGDRPDPRKKGRGRVKTIEGQPIKATSTVDAIGQVRKQLKYKPHLEFHIFKIKS
jgi:hypothetical protein